MRAGALTRGAFAALALVVLVSGCGSPSKTKAAHSGGAGQSPGSTAQSPTAAAPSPSASGSASAPQQTTSGNGSVTGQTPGPAVSSQPAKPGPTTRPTGPPTASAAELPISAAVTPACVPVGGTATLRIHTVAKAYLGYVAMYAGEKSGAQPPFGYGHGGNDKGEADYRGDWVGSWTVGPNAPVGRGRVVIVVGNNGKNREVDVPFSVGEREVNGCGTS